MSLIILGGVFQINELGKNKLFWEEGPDLETFCSNLIVLEAFLIYLETLSANTTR